MLRDVERERRHTLHLTHQASHDALTGLFNRAEFERCLSNAIDEAHEDGSAHALMYLDLDEFKLVNDTCGHAGGDELIRQAAALMRAKLRQTDILARLGGDEFGALLVHQVMPHLWLTLSRSDPRWDLSNADSCISNTPSHWA